MCLLPQPYTAYLVFLEAERADMYPAGRTLVLVDGEDDRDPEEEDCVLSLDDGGEDAVGESELPLDLPKAVL